MDSASAWEAIEELQSRVKELEKALETLEAKVKLAHSFEDKLD